MDAEGHLLVFLQRAWQYHLYPSIPCSEPLQAPGVGETKQKSGSAHRRGSASHLFNVSPSLFPLQWAGMLLATMANWAFQVIFLQWPLMAFMALPCDYFPL